MWILWMTSSLSSHSTSASVSELSRLLTHNVTAVSSPKCNSEKRPLSNSVAFQTLFKWHRYCCILKIHIVRKINTGIRYEPVYRPALQPRYAEYHERTTRRTLKQMGYSSRRPHRVPLLSAKNRKRRLQSAKGSPRLDNRSLENVAWSDESRFLLRHSDGRVRIWRKEHESMDPSCLVSTVQAGGGVMVWGIFSWHTLGPLVPIEHRLNATAYLSIVADHVHLFMTTVYHLLMATSSRIMHHVTKLKSSQTGFLNMTLSSLYSNGLHSHQISIQ